LLLFLLFMCSDNMTSANHRSHDFSSLPLHIDTTSTASKAPKNQIKRCCWRTSMEPRRQVGGRRDHTQFDAPETRDVEFASSIIKSGTYNHENCDLPLPIGQSLTIKFKILRPIASCRNHYACRRPKWTSVAAPRRPQWLGWIGRAHNMLWLYSQLARYR